MRIPAEFASLAMRLATAQPIRGVRPQGCYDSQYAHKPGLIAHEGRLHHFYCAVDAKAHRTLAAAVEDGQLTTY